MPQCTATIENLPMAFEVVKRCKPMGLSGARATARSAAKRLSWIS